MRRFIFAAAALIGAGALGCACPVSAQPRHDDERRDDRASGYDYGAPYDDQARGRDDRNEREAFGRDGERPAHDDGDWDRRDHDPHDHDRREAYGDGFRHRGARHYCWYEDGWRGRGSYICGYAWRARRGWAGAYEGDYEYRGLHYRGYWEDGAGRRYYDRGGYGVGHCDYGGPRPWSC